MQHLIRTKDGKYNLKFLKLWEMRRNPTLDAFTAVFRRPSSEEVQIIGFSKTGRGIYYHCVLDKITYATQYKQSHGTRITLSDLSSEMRNALIAEYEQYCNYEFGDYDKQVLRGEVA